MNWLKKLYLKKIGPLKGRVECPLCGYQARILKLGGKIGKCPQCITYARHRLIGFYLQDHLNVETRIKMLHVAPEPGLKTMITKRFPLLQYTDIDSGEGESGQVATHNIDLCSLPYPDDVFDLSICSHVLEHIEDDKKAIAELYRVMKPGGSAIILMPIEPDLSRTIEDPTIRSLKMRKKIFGQEDHVRRCGTDYWQRLYQVGFVRREEGYSFQGTDDQMRYFQMNEEYAEKDFYNRLDIFQKPESPKIR